MRPHSVFLAMAVVLAAACCPAAEEPKPEPGFVRLDNGKDLTGWYGSEWSGKPTGNHKGWSVVDGVIHLDVEAGNCHLFHRTTFSPNVVIRLQFRAAKAADSGLCIHGEQFQVRDYVNSLPDTQQYAFACKPPGEWNDMEFDFTGGVAVVKLNGKVIEKAWRAGKNPKIGLGLQRETGDFDYRFIRLKEKGGRNGKDEGCTRKDEGLEIVRSEKGKVRSAKCGGGRRFLPRFALRTFHSSLCTDLPGH